MTFIKLIFVWHKDIMKTELTHNDLKAELFNHYITYCHNMNSSKCDDNIEECIRRITAILLQASYLSERIIVSGRINMAADLLRTKKKRQYWLWCLCDVSTYVTTRN